MKRETIGLMMVVRNEKDRIKSCLNYHLPFVDEVAICDQSSNDGTWEILEEYKKASKIPFTIWKDINRGFCEPSKEATNKLLSTDWVLYIDADEKMNKDFLIKMHVYVLEGGNDGFTFKRNNIFDIKVYDDNVPIAPKWLRVQHPAHDYQLRLTRRSICYFPEQMHHRVRFTKKDAKVAKITQAIDHIKSIREQWDDNLRYKELNKKV
jgi:glycosyltransferase involved in cell wall biosynthesis